MTPEDRREDRLTRAEWFNYWFLGFLTFAALCWLILLTCFKEYWGFWQSPEVYRFLEKEYPQWFRSYVDSAYRPTFFGVIAIYSGWLLFSWRLRRLVAGWVAAVVLMTFMLGFAFGVMGMNNLISLIDRGEWHGLTPIQTKP